MSMDRNELNECLDRYLNGTLLPDDAARMMKAIREGGPDVEWLLDQIEAAGLIAQALEPITSEEFERGFFQKLQSENHPTEFVRRFESRRRLHGSADGSSSRASRFLWAAAASVLIAIGLFVWALRRPASSNTPPMAERPESPAEAPLQLEFPPPSPGVETPAPPRVPETRPAPRPEEVEPSEKPEPLPEKVPEPSLPKPKEPEPLPEPPEKERPVPETPKTVRALAKLEEVRGDVRISDSTDAPIRIATSGGDLVAGQTLDAMGGARAVLSFPDGTRVALGSDSRLELPAEGSVHLLAGTLQAQVSEQKNPMRFLTPQAEVQILGTVFSLDVSGAATRIEVTDGKVRFTRRSDGRSIQVREGWYALAAPEERLQARRIPSPLLSESFEDPGTFLRAWSTDATRSLGSVDVADGVLRFTAENSAGGWESWLANARQTFALEPLKLTARMRVSALPPNLTASLCVYDHRDNARGDRDHPQLLLRGGKAWYRTVRYVDGEPRHPVEASRDVTLTPGRWFHVEMTLTETEVTASVDGELIYRGPHKIEDLHRIRVGFAAGLKNDAEVRTVEVDDLRVAPLR